MRNLRFEDAVLLGFVQGVTEWLPISSSGHLALVQMFLGLKPPLFFDVMLHFGTLLVVLVFFRRNIINFVKKRDFKNDQKGSFLIKVFLGVIPTAIIGVFFSEIFESFFNNVFVVSVALLFTGFMLFISKYIRRENKELGFFQAFLVGIAQGVAIMPGISRSGFTIAVGLLLGVKREEAFKFSFAIFVPAVLGALVKTFIQDFEMTGAFGTSWLDILTGTTVATIIGYLSLKLLAKVLAENHFHLFAYYCWTIGLLTLSAVFFV